jgi:2,4-dienoyl-CoA reductase-like NADH-dependent reductase (Old Yellow Enzyme family)
VRPVSRRETFGGIRVTAVSLPLVAEPSAGHAADRAAIFAPVAFKSGLRVKNRLFRSSISGQFDDYNGHGSNARLNWEEQFARGGIGAIISSFVPVSVRGRILVRYATIDDDNKIGFWHEVGERVHKHGAKFLLQLSHSGRQQDIGGVENLFTRALSSTDKKDYFHGILAQRMTLADIRDTVRDFAEGARRARDAGLDGVELHGANGYLLTQFLSSAINDRTDAYGGSVANRARFVLEIVRAIRDKVGSFHLQMKINGMDHNDWLYPWEKKGNSLAETLEICGILEDNGHGVDAFHVSSGSTFPHPRNPPGDIPIDEARRWYDVMRNSGVRAKFNDFIFGNRVLGRVFRWWWRRKRGPIIEGINAAYAREVKKFARVPVLCTGGFQHANAIAAALRAGWCDAVAIARPLIANPDLPHVLERQNGPDPGRECTYCNRCLLNDLENPLGCYELSRYPGATFEERYAAMMRSVMSVFDPPAYPTAAPPAGEQS